MSVVVTSNELSYAFTLIFSFLTPGSIATFTSLYVVVTSDNGSLSDEISGRVKLPNGDLL